MTNHSPSRKTSRKTSARSKREPGRKRCSKCAELISLDEFYLSKRSRDGYCYICKECQCARTRGATRRKRHDKVEKFIRDYVLTLRRLARDRGRLKDAPEMECSVVGCHEVGILHHINYADPYAVIPLCRRHHAQLHQKWHLLERVALELGIQIEGVFELPFVPGIDDAALENRLVNHSPAIFTQRNPLAPPASAIVHPEQVYKYPATSEPMGCGC